MKRSLLDRALGYIGLQKRNNSVFSGTQTTRLTLDWIATILSANQELRGNLRLLRSRGRELSRNNPVAKNFLNLLAANVVGPHGISYQPQVRNNNGKLATDLNEKIEGAWIDWGKKGNCTVDGMHSWRSLQDLVIRNIATDGEVFIRHVPGFDNKYRYAVQLIDADQVDHSFSRPRGRGENEIRLGIEVDQWGRPVAYYVNAQHPSETVGSLMRERVEANGRQGDRPKIKRAEDEIIRVQVIDEPLITKADFDRVQKIVESKKRMHWRHRSDTTHNFTYQGFLVCGECGAPVYGKDASGFYYACASTARTSRQSAEQRSMRDTLHAARST